MTQHVMHCVRKKRYASETRSLEVIDRRQCEGAGYLRTYHCQMCQGWHLTSQRPRIDEVSEPSEPRETSDRSDGKGLKVGDVVWVIGLLGVAFEASVIRVQGKIMRVRCECPAGQVERWFHCHSGMPASKKARGLRVVFSEPVDLDGVVLMQWP